MTRFEREISGSLGAYWKTSAEKELDEIRAELAAGKITIDENGVARNCIGRVLMADMAEKLAWVTEDIDQEATAAAREIEVAADLAEYRAARQQSGYSAAEIHEMRAAFGPGAVVTDIFTGKTITL